MKNKKILLGIFLSFIILVIIIYILFETQPSFHKGIPERRNYACDLEASFVVYNQDKNENKCIKKQELSKIINCNTETHNVYIKNKKYHCEPYR